MEAPNESSFASRLDKLEKLIRRWGLSASLSAPEKVRSKFSFFFPSFFFYVSGGGM